MHSSNAIALMIVALSCATACGSRGISKSGGDAPNGTANGSTNAATNGTRNAATNGTTNAATNGTTNGTTNAATNGATNGQIACDAVTCAAGQDCIQGACVCLEGRSDCDGELENGCESTTACTCSPGETRPCYSGPADTRAVGSCQDGVQTCVPDGTGWSACDGDQLPREEICGDAIDNDCDGETDEGEDLDGDGFDSCRDDCCDSPADGCTTPSAVNPHAYDFANGFDDDCDGEVDNPPACAAPTKWSDATADELASALGVCSTSAANGWGLIDATLTQSHGAGAPGSQQRAVAMKLGGIVAPPSLSAMAILSTGTAAGRGDPGFQENVQVGTSSSGPADYLLAHGGDLPDVGQCASPTSIYDSVMLRLTLRAPANAQGLVVDYRYFSREFPTWVCTEFNDFFLLLVDSAAAGIPADQNIALDPLGNPITVNSDVITTCEPIACTAASDCAGVRTCVADVCQGSRGACPDGAADLDAISTDRSEAGATSWLRSTTPVVGGETLTLEFHIWDTRDAIMESWVLLDSVRWLAQTPQVETKPIP